MVFGGFDRVMDACSQLSFPALRLAVKLNLRYPVWFDETFAQDVLQKGITPAGQVAQFCELWKSRENFCIPLVLEVARKDQQDEFVQVAEDTLVGVFKTANSDPTEWEAMEILFEQYIENLNANKFYTEHEAFLAKMSQPFAKSILNQTISKIEQEQQLEKSERRVKAIEKSIEENYYYLINTIIFKGEMAARLVQYQIITMAEKQLIENSGTAPEAQARVLILNFIRKRPDQWNAFIAVLRECYSANNLAWALSSSYNRFMELLAYE